ncbi:universal stress protein [Marinoscillum pacificum]|uniref:universal stress protein n=1 Tax=Marinoscillum pacificum TaxID=392723 RepID=UPI002157AA8B|nr:universal stress protein [Marinoscillum pacificum]
MQAFKNILIPSDFSSAAWNAVHLGSSMAKEGFTEITLLHVFPSSAKFDSRKGELDLSDLDAIDEIKLQMDAFCMDLHSQYKVTYHPVILGGAVHEEICQHIRENDYDLVIIGVNSNGVDNRPGSHTSEIIANCHTPVLIAPNNLINAKTLVA